MGDSITRRERKKINSKKAIVAAAVNLFGQKGFQETTVADIMNEADLGIGTFYNYFQSKEEILKSLLAQIVEEINEFYEKLLKESKPADEVLTEMFLLTAKILDHNRFVLPLFLSAAHKGAMPKGAMHPANALSFKTIFDIIVKNGQKDGEFRDDIPAEVITEMFHAIFQAASFSSLEIGFMANIRYKLTLILDGIVIKK